jgi:serine/threonine protein phosphatase PrpC
VTTVETTSCPKCGEPLLEADDRFCEACGHALVDAATPEGDGESTSPTDGRVEVDLRTAAGASHRGHKHWRNEDAMYIAVTPQWSVAIVCDGVSASVNPHLASQAAVAVAGEALTAVGSGFDEDRLHTAIELAQGAVSEVTGTSDGPLGAPACTLAAAVWDGERIVVGNVGDSRVYWIDDSASLLLSEDDSWMHMAMEAGLDPSAAELDVNAHAITRWLGADAPGGNYRVGAFVPSGPGRLIVCSDGLWNYAPEPDDIAHLVASSETDGSPHGIANALVDVALVAGGHDNVTVAVIDVTPNQPSHSLTTEEAS